MLIRLHWDIANVKICLALLSQFIELSEISEITISLYCITNACNGKLICSVFKLFLIGICRSALGKLDFIEFLFYIKHD